MRTPVFSHRAARLRFHTRNWQALLAELKRRGEHRRESGAFLLTARGDSSGRIKRVVYYDDLDPDCLQGAIIFHGYGYSNLWDICVDEGFDLIADVHTHPGPSVAQSLTDREHPMYARSGHIGLIVPRYATGTVSAKQVGVHEYFGDEGWESHFNHDAQRLLHIGRWA